MTPHDALALILLALAACALAVWIVVCLRRSPYTPAQSAIYFLAVLLTRVLWRARVPRRLPLTPGCGALVIANHRSSVDPLFIQLAADRPVHWMVAREYCEHPAFAWLLRICEVIPVSRGGSDTAAAKAAIRIAADGGLVGMLPEGRINMTDQLLLPVRPGAVLVAIKARTPILPCYIDGAPYGRATLSPLLMTARVRVLFGEPIDLSDYYGCEPDPQTVQDLMLRCMKAIAELAGALDYRPRLAGRRWKPKPEELAAAASAHVRRRGKRQR